MTKKDTSNYNPVTDFDLETDVKAPATIPDGTYYANVVSVVHNVEKHWLAWKVSLEGNGGMCTDEETPIDGAVLTFNNWLPKDGDQNEMTASGRQTKLQAKINQLGAFMKKMKLTQTKLSDIIEAIDNAEYIGLNVKVKISTREYQGNIFNDIQDMSINE